MAMEDEYFTVDEVAKRLKVTRKTVYEWMRGGVLRYVVVGERRRIPGSALAAFVRPGMPDEDFGQDDSQKKLAPLAA